MTPPRNNPTSHPETLIRSARLSDAKAMLEIYAPYVRNTAVTFEYNVPTVEEFSERISCTQKSFPWLVIEDKGTIRGYAYATPFHERAAFGHSAECSVYIHPSAHRQGFGKRLYNCLENILARQGITNLNASIAYTRQEDEFLSHDSPHFHQKAGFRTVAHFNKCGYKFNRWYDLIWMEKIIAPHTIPAPVFRICTDLTELF